MTGADYLATARRIRALADELNIQSFIMRFGEGARRDSPELAALRASYQEDIALTYLEIEDFKGDCREAGGVSGEGIWKDLVIADAGGFHGYAYASHDVPQSRAVAAMVWARDVIVRHDGGAA